MADNKSEIRIGRVSSVNYAHGMVRVTYPDRDDSVTAEIPVLSFTDEYKMPKVGSQVLVAHLSNGAAAGVCLGHYWNERNISKKTGEGVFRKELGQSYGEAFIEFKDGTVTIHADKIKLDGVLTVTKGVTASGDVKAGAGGLSLTQHTHTGVNGETSKPH